MGGHGPEERHLVVNNTMHPGRCPRERSCKGLVLAVKLQLVFDGAVNDPDEVDVPAEQKDQEPLSL